MGCGLSSSGILPACGYGSCLRISQLHGVAEAFERFAGYHTARERLRLVKVPLRTFEPTVQRRALGSAGNLGSCCPGHAPRMGTTSTVTIAQACVGALLFIRSGASYPRRVRRTGSSRSCDSFCESHHYYFNSHPFRIHRIARPLMRKSIAVILSEHISPEGPGASCGVPLGT